MRTMRWYLASIASGLLLVALGSTFWAAGSQGEQRPVPQQNLDKTLYRGLGSAINQGVDLYQAGDHYGCYRLFHGILLTLKLTLADRPEVQQIIDSGLADAERQPKTWERAWTLRRSLDQVRARLLVDPMQARLQAPAESAKGDKGMKEVEPRTKATLWDRLGGKAKVTRIVDDFIKVAVQDPKVNFTRGGKHQLSEAELIQFKKELVEFISSASGGPLTYTGKKIKAAHKGMHITNAEFEAAVADLKKVLQDNDVKKAEIDEVVGAVESTRKDIVEELGAKPGPNKIGNDKKLAPPNPSHE
jgi:hemoglobin